MTTHLVRDWMSKPVIVVDPDSSVSHALTLMRRRRIHSLLVEDRRTGMPVYGIITTTDIRDKIVAAGRDPAETTVGAIMTASVQFAAPDWTLQQCSSIMQERNFHHMPVCDEDDVPVGMISATDIFIAVEERGWVEDE
ncbi:MAG: cyclic nucleotide-binding/CBS domain-containing protein [Anaerolineales bacterium]